MAKLASATAARRASPRSAGGAAAPVPAGTAGHASDGHCTTGEQLGQLQAANKTTPVESPWATSPKAPGSGGTIAIETKTAPDTRDPPDAPMNTLQAGPS